MVPNTGQQFWYSLIDLIHGKSFLVQVKVNAVKITYEQSFQINMMATLN